MPNHGKKCPHCGEVHAKIVIAQPAGMVILRRVRLRVTCGNMETRGTLEEVLTHLGLWMQEVACLRRQINRDGPELERLRRWEGNLYQDRCENAYVESALLDAVKQALAEVAPDHPVLKAPCPSYGVWATLSRNLKKAETWVERLRAVLHFYAGATREYPDKARQVLADLAKARGDQA